MKPLRTKFSYHDSVLVDVAWPGESDLKLTFQLNGHWNGGSSHVTSVFFYDLNDRAAVEASLREIESKSAREQRPVEVLDLWRESRNSYVVETVLGSINVDARSLFEA